MALKYLYIRMYIDRGECFCFTLHFQSSGGANKPERCSSTVSIEAETRKRSSCGFVNHL